MRHLAPISLLVLFAGQARAEVILQYFETPWREIEARVPEVAAAGYDALWLPPPTKGTEGIRDVGFAVYDRFDLGDGDAGGGAQRGTIETRYGSKDELISLVETAHRFGIRVYFDVVMNHNGNPAGIENVGVSLLPVELNGFPGTSVWDYHVLPARNATNGTCNGGGSGCVMCAFQPGATGDNDFNGGRFDGKQWRVINSDGSYIGGGGEICLKPEGGEARVAAITIEEALGDPGAPAQAPSIWNGYTHVVRAPRMFEFDDFQFQVSNWTLLGLHDFATEQYEDGNGPTPIDGTNAVIGTELPRFVRDADRPETYQYEENPAPHDEDIREYLMRWIRWLMMETKADGFRLDAIKHIWPNFYGNDFNGDRVAFNKVIQDTYDEMHGFNDADDADLVDDAAIFGEDFTGSCSALRPYIESGMRALDFPLFFNLGSLMFGGDIGQYSANNVCDDPTVGAFHGLNRRSGVAFAQSHDECQKNESVDTSNTSQTFSRCSGAGGKPDLVYAYILAREADSTVFFDGNRWTSQSFVRSGRTDALLEVIAGQPDTTLFTLVNAARRVSRGAQQNRWVGGDGYVFERVVGGRGPTGLIALNDANRDVTWGDGGSEGSFIVTTFVPGTVLCEITNTALDFGRGCYDVLDPAALGAAEQPEVDAARANYRAAHGGVDPPGGHGVFYTGLSSDAERSYAIYAPPAFAEPTGTDDDVVEILDIPTATLAPGVHALHVRFRREVTGAADAQDEFVIPLCVASNGDTGACGASTSGAPGPTDPIERGIVEIVVDGAAADRVAIETAGARNTPFGASVSAAKVFYAVIDGDSLDVRIKTGAELSVEDIGIRIDDDPNLVPGFHLNSTPERFLDGFTELFPPGQEPPPDAGFPNDAGVDVPDSGVTDPDGGFIDPDGDDDGDGITNDDDNCVALGNADQADFDEDGVGDACDLCVLEGNTDTDVVNATGCRPVSQEEHERILAIARAIAERASPTPDTDLNADDIVDVLDLDQAITEAHQ